MILEYLLLISVVFIFWTFAGYPVALIILSKIIQYRCRKSMNRDVNYTPTVSIIIPTYNEESAIEKKLRNCLELDYPEDKLEILVVDSSTDLTPIIVKEYEKRYKNIKLIREDMRRGKASAINYAISHAHGEFIVVTDANAFVDKHSLRMMIQHFIDRDIGAVEANFVISNAQQSIIASKESDFRRFENLLRTIESLIDSTVGVVGELSIFRRDIITNLKFDTNSLAEDLEISIRIRKNGLKILHESNAVVYENAPLTIKEGIIQKKRRTIGTIQSLVKHKDVIFNTKYGFYGVLILPSHKLFQVISPLFFALLIISSYTCLLFGNPLGLIFYVTLSLMIVSIIGLLTLKFEVSQVIFNTLGYFLLNQLIVIQAWISFLSKRYTVTWELVKSTRL